MAAMAAGSSAVATEPDGAQGPMLFSFRVGSHRLLQMSKIKPDVFQVHTATCAGYGSNVFNRQMLLLPQPFSYSHHLSLNTLASI